MLPLFCELRLMADGWMDIMSIMNKMKGNPDKDDIDAGLMPRSVNINNELVQETKSSE